VSRINEAKLSHMQLNADGAGSSTEDVAPGRSNKSGGQHLQCYLPEYRRKRAFRVRAGVVAIVAYDSGDAARGIILETKRNQALTEHR
jgi:hypothetical protein